MLGNRGDSIEKVKQEAQEHLEKEIPTLFSAVLERACTLQCEHCLFQKEVSSARVSEKENTHDSMLSLVKQMPEEGIDGQKPRFLHSGRILTRPHIELFSAIRKERPDVKLGLIDAGGYVNLIKKFDDEGVQLDWIDISLDGTKESHNDQRDPERRKSFDTTIEGLRRAREVVKPKEEGGRVSSLFTLTTLNFKDVEGVAEILLSPDDQGNSLVDTMFITTMAPYRDSLKGIEVNIDDMTVAWEQVQSITKKYGDRVVFRLYRHEDVEKLAHVVGVKKFLDAVEDVQVDLDDVFITVDGVEIRYTPLSTWPKEELIVDADSWVRVAGGAQYTLNEYKRSEASDDMSADAVGRYNVEKVSADSDYADVYKHVVNAWWERFGDHYFDEEVAVFDRLREQVKS